MAPQPNSLPRFDRRVQRAALRDRGPGSGFPRGPLHERRAYRPGEPVLQTGIYEVAHEHEHRAPHDAVMHAGDAFPECDVCFGAVRFRLVRSAPYIFEDEDFAPEQ